MSAPDDLTDRHSDRIATTEARLEGLAAAQTRIRRDGRRRVIPPSRTPDRQGEGRHDPRAGSAGQPNRFVAERGDIIMNGHIIRIAGSLAPTAKQSQEKP